MQAQRSNGTMSHGELDAIVKKVMASMQNGDEGEEANGWSKPAAKPINAPFLGVSVPIKVETPIGSARCYLSLPPEVASSPEALIGAIKQLLDKGIPVDIFRQRPNNDWNGNRGGGGNWQNNGGYGGGGGRFNNGGGYNNGGFRRGGQWQ